ncbi:PLxRFG domain-containing protein [Comamonas jiangduensis]
MLDLAKRDARVQRYAIDWKKNAPDAPLQLQALRERGYSGSELTAQYEALAIEEGLAVVAQELAARKLPGTALTLRVRQLAGWFAGVAQRMGMSRLAASIRKLTYNDAERFVMTAIDAAGRGTDARASMDAMYRTQGSGERSEGGAMRGLDLAQAMKVLEQSQAGMSAQMIAQVNKVVDGIRKTWVNAPEVVVAYGMEDAKIPKEALATDSLQRSEGAEGDPEGFYWEGKVYLLADMLHTPNDVARVFFHEALGHHGLRGVFGKQLDGVLEQITVMRKADVAAKLTQYGLQNTPKGRRVAAEEVLAEMAQATPEIGFVKRALAAVRTWLRANVPGFKSLQLSDAEIIRDYILPARAWVERGGPDGNGPRGGLRIEPVMSRAEAGSTTDQTQTANFKRWYGDWQNATQGVPNNDSINLDARGERALNTVQREGSVGAYPDGATRVGDFTFPGASGPVGRDGAPARFFHGTRDDITAFDRGAASRKDNGWLGAGFYFTSEPFIADLYSGAKQGAVGRNTMPVYVAVRNPYVASHAEKAEMKHWTRERLEQHTQALIEQGYDGVVLEGDGGVIELVAFEPTQVKSAIGNNGDFDPANPDIRFSRAAMAELKNKGLQLAHTYMSHPGKVSLWDKTVGTMRHISERYPAFKPVFEAAQQFIDDVSSIANEAAQYAPRLIPRVETVRDMLKKPISVVDNKAIGKALFGGNLDWGRDQHGKAMPIDELKAKYAGLTVDQKAEVLLAAGKVQQQLMAAMRGKQLEQFESFINNRFDSTILKAGVAFNHKELRDFFGMNEQQISLYDEARATVDKSLDITARAEMLRALGRDWDGFRDMVMDAPTLTDAWKLLDDELEQRAKAIPDSRDQMAAKMFQIRASHDKARELMDSGYMPLQRFGKYTVWARDKDGETIYYSMHESQAESNRMAETMRREYPDATVTQGTVNEDKYKLFAGITPETAELFGSMLGLDAAGNDAKDQAFQEFLKLSKNNHSALKRLIHRKGIAGYSEDVGRVLASFVYSNARLAATGLNAGKMEAAINDLNTTHKEQGELGKIAAKLRSYIQDPQEEGQVIRGMLFAQYLGGSLASAAVNMTQPFAVTMPWLSQYGGMAKASKYMSGALKDMTQSALKKGFSYEPDLAHALKMAEDDGTVSPQEIHQLMAQSRGAGGLRTGDGTKIGDARAAASNAWEKGKVAWGQPFALAEQFNRRSTFIAAYRIARDRGMDNPAQFARRAVVETQFLYTKANKPQWARGAIGGTLFTFKTYSVSFLELMHRTWNAGEPGSPERAAGRRAVGWAMLMLMLMGGAGGLPFVEDVEDLVDGAGQMMGYNFSLKQERKQFMAKMLGAELANFMETGLSGLPGAPIDVSGRLGMDNLIPGTGLALNKQSSTRDIVEMLGPAGDLVSRAFSGAGDMLAGLFTADAARMGRGAMEVMPTAVRNAVKGADMAASGIYKDSKGYKIIDTRFDEALWKMIGFQPRAVAEVQESNSFMQRSKSFYIQTSNEIRAQWAKALFEKDEAAVKRARERVAQWNENNPDQPIRINMPDIWKRAAQMGKDRTDRIADTAPKALRQQLRDMAQEQSR